jgi:hypothetical protein
MARNVARQSVAHAKLSNDNDAIAMSESGHDRLIKTTLAVVEQCAMFSGPVLGLLDPTAAGRDVPSVDNRDGSTFYPHDGGMHSIDFHVRLLGKKLAALMATWDDTHSMRSSRSENVTRADMR